MENSETKKTNKYVALATYLIAVVCLLLGLFLPLFNGKGILALQLPDALNCLANKHLFTAKKFFEMSYPVHLFGMEKVTLDVMALVVILYAAITLLALIALVPIGFAVKKDKSLCGLMFAVEAAAVIVLSVYLIIGLEYIAEVKLSYNMIIALCGALLMLIVLSVMHKGATGAAKTALFLLSAISFLMLFSLVTIIPKLAEPLIKLGDKTKIYPCLFGEEDYSGVAFLQVFFEQKLNLKLIPSVKLRALNVIAIIFSLVVLINFIIDVAGLGTNAKKVGHHFNLIRYGLEFAVIICLFITVLACKYKPGMFLIIITVTGAVQLIISFARYLMFRRRRDDESELSLYEQPVKQPKQLPQDTRNAYGQALLAQPEAVAEQTVIKEVAAIPPQVVEPEQPETEVLYADPNAVQTVIEDITPPSVAEVKQQAKPVEPIIINITQPAEEVEEVKPVQEIIIEKPEPKPQPKPLPKPEPKPQPKPEPKPVQPEPEKPVETRIYTINTIYGGPSDEFIKKLTNDEKIEFARTFIEKSKGEIGNIPEYVVGGNNRKFFSAVFIYLGRIRGLISDDLLNKMYKELNMM